MASLLMQPMGSEDGAGLAWIDTHCHLDAAELTLSASVRQAAADAGVRHCVIPAVARSNWQAVRDLAHAGKDSYALGIHPLYTPAAHDADLEHLADTLQAHQDDPRLVAVGEIGLDYFVPGLDRDRQMRFYTAQLRLARRLGLPVILHVRRSADMLLKALRQHPVQGGIAHAFNGSLQQAQCFIDMGFKLGFGGAVTFDRALQLRRLATQLPLEAIVLETDAPDMPPHWLYVTAAQRAQGVPAPINTSAQLPRIAQVVAHLRSERLATLALATAHNAQVALPRLSALL
jgi:TatD DNase family protein